MFCSFSVMLLYCVLAQRKRVNNLNLSKAKAKVNNKLKLKINLDSGLRDFILLFIIFYVYSLADSTHVFISAYKEDKRYLLSFILVPILPRMDYLLYPYGNNAYVLFYLTMPYIITLPLGRIIITI